jgi:RNA polymerase sigma-70 factor (ECF subfamily)
LRGWLFRIASHAAADHYRKRAAAWPNPELPRREPLDATEAERIEARCLLYQLVPRLTDEQRRVIELRFAYDRSLRETARELGRSVGAVKQLQLRALRRLRAWAEENR